MHHFTDISHWQQHRQFLNPLHTIGFVPTMGCLHQGHAALIERSMAENDITVVSIFVNPTQFNESSDYENYPNTLEKDIALLTKLGVNVLLTPTKDAMYPKHNQFTIETTHPLASILEGEYRPGHFTGVLTIVMKFLQLVQPHRSYFGEKDYQQLMLIDAMAKAFFVNTEIIGCNTVREKSGLAFSSRNARLSEKERLLAELFAAELKTQDIETLKAKLTENNITIDYVEEHDGRRFAAVRIGDIRLIDNITTQ